MDSRADKLEHLFDNVVLALAEGVNAGDPKAIANAIKFLKDNDITMSHLDLSKADGMDQGMLAIAAKVKQLAIDGIDL